MPIIFICLIFITGCNRGGHISKATPVLLQVSPTLSVASISLTPTASITPRATHSYGEIDIIPDTPEPTPTEPPYTLPPPYVFITKWGSPGSGDGQFDSPGDIAIDNEGYIYVLDTNNKRLQKFDSDGNFMIKWALNTVNKKIRGYFYDSIAVDQKGYIFVGDTYNDCIEKFDSKGNFIKKWDGIYPRKIRTDMEGHMFIISLDTVEKLTPEGNFIKQWEPSQFDYSISGHVTCLDMTVIPSGDIFLVYGIVSCDEYQHVSYVTIHKFDSDWNFITRWGPGGIKSSKEFDGSTYITSDKKGNIFTANGNSLRMFDSNGNFIGKWWVPDTGIADITVDSDGNIYISEPSKCRIQKFAPNPEFKVK